MPTAATKITTNLLGRTVRMSAGLRDAPNETMRRRARSGERGEVVAVRKNEKDAAGRASDLLLTVLWGDTQKVEDMAADHLAILSPNEA